MTQPAPGAVSSADLWDLQASPSSLQEMADGWRRLRRTATSSQETVDRAAHRVFADEAWLGDTADRYDDHRRRVTRDVGRLAERAGPVADALEELAEVLRVNQDLLSDERARLADVPTTGSGENLVFHPRDEEQERRVTQAINAAREIRARVDEALAARRAAFESAQADLDAIRDTWKPRSVRMLNLNIGSGNDRNPNEDKPGVDPGEVGELAELIEGQDPDVVTLQEVFEEDLGDLKTQLEERTGDQWEVRFEEASTKARWTSWLNPGVNEPFGNAVLVRTGDVIEGVGESEGIKLDVEGDEVAPGVGDGEGRAATEVEVRFNPRR